LYLNAWQVAAVVAEEFKLPLELPYLEVVAARLLVTQGYW
jgi:hypothetical protein